MIAYDAQQHEALVIQWWANLDEDRDVTFHSSAHRLGAFLKLFAEEAALLFECDKAGIWFAAWTQPLCDGVTFSLWIRKDKRHSPEAWKSLQIAYNVVFDRYPVVIGYTRQPHLHAVHLKLGYEYAGRIPNIADRNTLYIYSMSREQWQNRREAARKIRDEKRAKRSVAEARAADDNG